MQPTIGYLVQDAVQNQLQPVALSKERSIFGRQNNQSFLRDKYCLFKFEFMPGGSARRGSGLIAVSFHSNRQTRKLQQLRISYSSAAILPTVELELDAKRERKTSRNVEMAHYIKYLRATKEFK